MTNTPPINPPCCSDSKSSQSFAINNYELNELI